MNKFVQDMGNYKKNMTREELGRKLEKIRKDREISTYYITKYFGIRFEAIKAIEQGSSNYTIDNLIKYLDAIGVSIYFS